MKRFSLVALLLGLSMALMFNAPMAKGDMYAKASLRADGTGGNGGWYRFVEVPKGQSVSVTADWAGDIGNTGWAVVLLWTTDDPNDNFGARADAGAPQDTAFKKASYALLEPMNPPTAWDWEAASLSPFGDGNTVLSEGYVVVAVGMGSVQPASDVWAAWDNITLSVEGSGNLLPNGDWSNGENGWTRYAAGSWATGTFSFAVIPVPGAALLGFMGFGLVGWIKRRFA